MFGLATSGQLGLGNGCVDKAFKPELVSELKVQKVALGDTHSLVLSLNGHLLTCGSNDKYQLGINPDQRDLKIFSFTQVSQFKMGDKYEKYQKSHEIIFKEIACWNLNAAIDLNDRVYLWGILHDK